MIDPSEAHELFRALGGVQTSKGYEFEFRKRKPLLESTRLRYVLRKECVFVTVTLITNVREGVEYVKEFPIMKLDTVNQVHEFVALASN